MAHKITFNKQNWQGDTADITIFRHVAKTRDFTIHIPHIEPDDEYTEAAVFETMLDGKPVAIFTLYNTGNTWHSPPDGIQRQHKNPFVLAAIMAYNLI